MEAPHDNAARAAAIDLAIVGSGPTAVYTVQHLLDVGATGRVIICEASGRAGVGIPYSRASNSPEMLANIASIELPPVIDTLENWARAQGRPMLADLGIDADAIDARTFLPRILLGDYYADQLAGLVARGADHGLTIEILSARRVVDIAAFRRHTLIVSQDETGAIDERTFAAVVVATGHAAPRGHGDDAGLVSAYPVSDALSHAERIGVLGTSLSAIDVVVGEAARRGEFVGSGDRIEYRQRAERRFLITMMSRSGVLPETDFYCPIPYEPLDVFTEAAAARCADLDALFALMCRQIERADPAYAAAIGLQDATADDFAERYFAPRLAVPTLDWAEANVREAERNAAEARTVGWRYAILRIHEPFGRAVARLSEGDLARFERGLKRVFVDNYAAVPALSVRRLLALRDAGVLDVAAIGVDYRLERMEAGWTVAAGERLIVCDVLVDARGQRPLDRAELAFPTLRMQVHTATAGSARELAVDGDFRLGPPGSPLGRVWFAAVPYLLRRRPFIQGLTASHEMGLLIARSLVADSTPAADGNAAERAIAQALESLHGTALIHRAGPGGFEPLTVAR